MAPMKRAMQMRNYGLRQWTVISVLVVSEKTLRRMFSVPWLMELLASPRLLQLLMAQFCSSESEHQSVSPNLHQIKIRIFFLLINLLVLSPVSNNLDSYCASDML